MVAVAPTAAGADAAVALVAPGAAAAVAAAWAAAKASIAASLVAAVALWGLAAVLLQLHALVARRAWSTLLTNSVGVASA